MAKEIEPLQNKQAAMGVLGMPLERAGTTFCRCSLIYIKNFGGIIGLSG
ncbi:MAG: hypothetical protein JSW26_04030 [Desulfobacterales bacterium]|nr:MAG: hypothetical protein JSW26_04030 [Desulfobacterales bacterium]